MLSYPYLSYMGLQRTILNIRLDMLRELVAIGNMKMLSEERSNELFGETFWCEECISRMRFVTRFRVKGITHFPALAGFDESRFPESSRLHSRNQGRATVGLAEC